MTKATLLLRESNASSLIALVQRALHRKPPSPEYELKLTKLQIEFHQLSRSEKCGKATTLDEGFESDIDSVSIVSSDDSFTSNGETSKNQETDSANGSACSDSDDTDSTTTVQTIASKYSTLKKDDKSGKEEDDGLEREEDRLEREGNRLEREEDRLEREADRLEREGDKLEKEESISGKDVNRYGKEGKRCGTEINECENEEDKYEKEEKKLRNERDAYRKEDNCEKENSCIKEDSYRKEDDYTKEDTYRKDYIYRKEDTCRKEDTYRKENTCRKEDTYRKEDNYRKPNEDKYHQEDKYAKRNEDNCVKKKEDKCFKDLPDKCRKEEYKLKHKSAKGANEAVETNEEVVLVKKDQTNCDQPNTSNSVQKREVYNLVKCLCYTDVKAPNLLLFVIDDEVLVFKFEQCADLQKFYATFSTLKAVANQKAYGRNSKFSLLQRTDSDGVTHLEVERDKKTMGNEESYERNRAEERVKFQKFNTICHLKDRKDFKSRQRDEGRLITVEELGKKFEGFEKKLDGCEKKFDGYEKKFDGYEKKFDGHEKKFDGYEKKFDGNEKKFDGFEKKFNGCEKKLDGFEKKLDGFEKAASSENILDLDFDKEERSKLGKVWSSVEDLLSEVKRPDRKKKSKGPAPKPPTEESLEQNILKGQFVRINVKKIEGTPEGANGTKDANPQIKETFSKLQNLPSLLSSKAKNTFPTLLNQSKGKTVTYQQFKYSEPKKLEDELKVDSNWSNSVPRGMKKQRSRSETRNFTPMAYRYIDTTQTVHYSGQQPPNFHVVSINTVNMSPVQRKINKMKNFGSCGSSSMVLPATSYSSTNQSTNYQTLSYGTTNHGSTNQASTNHATTNHASTNHASANHATTNHGSTNHASTNNASANHATTNHASTNHASTNHASTNHASMNHPHSNYSSSKNSLPKYPSSNYSSSNYASSNYPSPNYSSPNYPSTNYSSSNYSSSNFPHASNFPSPNFTTTNYVTTNYPQSNYSQANFSQTNYPQANYPQANYPQANYPQANYPQANYPQTNYPPTNFPQTLNASSNSPANPPQKTNFFKAGAATLFGKSSTLRRYEKNPKHEYNSNTISNRLFGMSSKLREFGSGTLLNKFEKDGRWSSLGDLSCRLSRMDGSLKSVIKKEDGKKKDKKVTFSAYTTVQVV